MPGPALEPEGCTPVPSSTLGRTDPGKRPAWGPDAGGAFGQGMLRSQVQCLENVVEDCTSSLA